MLLVIILNLVIIYNLFEDTFRCDRTGNNSQHSSRQESSVAGSVTDEDLIEVLADESVVTTDDGREVRVRLKVYQVTFRTAVSVEESVSTDCMQYTHHDILSYNLFYLSYPKYNIINI